MLKIRNGSSPVLIPGISARFQQSFIDPYSREIRMKTRQTFYNILENINGIRPMLLLGLSAIVMQMFTDFSPPGFPLKDFKNTYKSVMSRIDNYPKVEFIQVM